MATHRPDSFDEIIGQQDVIRRLKISTFGCSKNNKPLSHVLLDGPPGLGKTTIASAIANELGVELMTANAASIRSVGSMTKYLLNISRNCILFIDEIHRLPKLVEEFLYPVMEDFKATIILESEPEEIDIPPFTLVGATTSGGTLSQPFYDRFTIKEHLSFYNCDELAKLARLNAHKSGLSLSEEKALEIAQRSKGTPRILNARMEWYQNYTSYFKDNTNSISVNEVFLDQGIDQNGLDENDRKYIEILKKNLGNPLGIKNISSMTGLAIDTIENSIEPYLVRMGYVIRTSKGRILGQY
jgi:Holliday junction DNA helicase RuvB